MEANAANDSALEQARALCRLHRDLFIADVTDRVRGQYVHGWVVYRRVGEGIRPTRLGRRRDPVQLLRFVRQLTADPVHA